MLKWRLFKNLSLLDRANLLIFWKAILYILNNFQGSTAVMSLQMLYHTRSLQTVLGYGYCDIPVKPLQ